MTANAPPQSRTIHTYRFARVSFEPSNGRKLVASEWCRLYVCQSRDSYQRVAPWNTGFLRAVCLWGYPFLGRPQYNVGCYFPFSYEFLWCVCVCVQWDDSRMSNKPLQICMPELNSRPDGVCACLPACLPLCMPVVETGCVLKQGACESRKYNLAREVLGVFKSDMRGTICFCAGRKTDDLVEPTETYC